MSRIEPQLEEWIAADLENELTAEERAQLEARLAADPAARARKEELEAVKNAVESNLAAARPPGDFETRMVAAFRRGVSARRRPWHVRILGWWRLPAVYIPAAAAVLIGLVQVGSMLTGERAAMALAGAEGENAEQYWARGNEKRDRSFFLGLPRDKELNAPATPAIVPEAEVRRDLGLEEEKFADGLTTLYDVLPRGEVAKGWKELAQGRGMREESEKGMADGALIAQTGPALQSQTATRNPEPQAAQVMPPSSAPNARTLDQLASSAEDEAIVDSRKLIRNAGLEIEVESFSKALAEITAYTTQAGGFIATQSSDRLPNGKVTGTLVTKVPPSHLEQYLEWVRNVGELKNQTLGTQDVTRAYSDTAARLRNAQNMEQRLLELLRTTKGKVSDLLEVEREVGRVREQIEQMQGQMKLWDTLAQFATVTIRLHEKDLNEPAAFLIKERANLSLMAADVEPAFQRAKEVAAEAGAQVLESELRRESEHQVSATMRLLIDPERADDTIARMKALGQVASFTRTTERVAQDGTGEAGTGKVERDRVLLAMTIAPESETPIQRTNVSVQTGEVEKEAERLKTFAASAGMEIKRSAFERMPDGRQAALLTIDLPLSETPRLMEQIEAAGKVKDLSVQRVERELRNDETARAETSVRLFSQADLVTEETGIGATLRRTFEQAFGAVMWSIRMIGVALAFLAPWALVAGLAGWFGIRLMQKRRKP